MNPSVLIAGATGLTGRIVVERLENADVHIILRKPVAGFPEYVVQHVADPAAWPDIIRRQKTDVAISCLGTTWKKSGRIEMAFRAVDHDLVLAVAVAAKAAGAKHFISISSVGASAKASGLYLRTKGETDAALMAMGFARLDILQPGLLIGARSDDPRLGERLGMMISPLTNLLTPQVFSKYRSISAETVATAICRLVRETDEGLFIHENDAIHALSG